MSGDLAAAELRAVLGDRPVRTYPALLSTEAEAMAWARGAAAPPGALVVADYQASPRGRGGLPWRVRPGIGLGFSLLARPDLAPEREGWPYLPASLAVAEVVGQGGVEWPDLVVAPTGLQPLARVAVHVEFAPGRTGWASVTVLVDDVTPPRGPLLGRLVDALERRLADSSDTVLAAYRTRCVTLGRQVRARMIPMAPGGPQVTGEAVDVLADGALVLLTHRGTRIAIPVQGLGLLEAPEAPPVIPEEVRRRLGSGHEDLRRTAYGSPPPRPPPPGAGPAPR